MIPVDRSPFRRARRGRLALAVAFARAVVLVVVLAGCSSVLQTAPAPTPADFPAIAGVLSQRGIRVDRIVSGDAGCEDVAIGRTAIGFDASGLDQATPVRVRIYIFRNRATYDRLRSTIDSCAGAYVTEPATFESFDTSPYVVAGQGPWAASFREAIRASIREAAGTGG